MNCTSKAKLVEILKKQIAERDSQAVKALLTVYENQTASEQNSKEVQVPNGIGFMVSDANFGTKLAEYYKNGNRFSEKQMKYIKEIMPKYAGQLINQSIRNGYIKKVGNLYVWGN